MKDFLLDRMCACVCATGRCLALPFIKRLQSAARQKGHFIKVVIQSCSTVVGRGVGGGGKKVVVVPQSKETSSFLFISNSWKSSSVLLEN